jgi:hypothetical protein
VQQPAVSLISRGDIARSLSISRSLELAEIAYAATATGHALHSSLGHVAAPDGEFHIKGSGLVVDGRLFAAVKVAAYFPARTLYRVLVLETEGTLRLARGVRDPRPTPAGDRRLHRRLPPPAPLRAGLPHAARGRGHLERSRRPANPRGLTVNAHGVQARPVDPTCRVAGGTARSRRPSGPA